MSRGPGFKSHVLVDETPMPDDIPKVPEIGSTSAPLLSASYFIGARCRQYNDDFMQCKSEANGKGELECLKEGRKVTRCAASVLADIRANCLDEFRAHWDCLENRNHQLWECRRPERRLNKCVFDKIGLEKTIPNTPKDETPVHLRQHQIYATAPQHEPGHPEAIGDVPRFWLWVGRMLRSKESEETLRDPVRRQEVKEKYLAWKKEKGWVGGVTDKYPEVDIFRPDR